MLACGDTNTPLSVISHPLIASVPSSLGRDGGPGSLSIERKEAPILLGLWETDRPTIPALLFPSCRFVPYTLGFMSSLAM